MSRILATIHDELPFGAVDDIPDNVYKLSQPVSEFLDMSAIDMISEVIAYHDPNGLRPTDSELDVIKAVLFALDRTDEHWSEHDFPGSPSVTDYAANAAVFLQKRYGESI